MDPWIWLLLGLALLAVELFTPGGFYLLFFGIGALLVGLLSVIPVPFSTSLPLQVAIFLITSLTGLLLFRNALLNKFRRRSGRHEVDSLTNTAAAAQEDILPGAIGKVELRGSSWNARNTGDLPITLGQRCTVDRVDGLTVLVRLAVDPPNASPDPHEPPAASPPEVLARKVPLA